MAENSKIEWTSNTWNPWIGCTKVSPGCAHCYAETLMDERYGKVKWGPNGTRVRTSAAYWRKPLIWDVAAVVEGRTIRVFPSLCDPFEDWEGPIMSGGKSPVALSREGRASNGSNRMTMDDVRREMFKLIDATPHLDWLLLTKRPENVRRMWPTCDACCNRDRCPGPPECTRDYRPECSRCNGTGMYRPNVWLGTSVENQETANERIHELRNCRDLSPVLWLSYEPALAAVNFGSRLKSIDWLIVGGESGPAARFCNVAWIRWAILQCQAAGVACFVKQLGAIPIDPPRDAIYENDVWNMADIKDPKGGNWDEWPEDLRVREYPQVAIERR
jgi:protein gp37